MHRNALTFGLALFGSAVLLTATGCGGPGASGEGLSGAVRVDGSSTVFPISEAVAEEFLKLYPGVRVTVGMSGTGGGFKKFCAGETDITGASRPIATEEMEACEAAGIEFIELPIAFDGLSVVVNPRNTWVDYLTVEELKRIWEPGSQITSWKDVRPGFPDVPLRLYGPGTDSGTFDYFTKAIVGTEKASRPDFQASEDDNTLVTGVAGDEGALGYFGFAYYVENQNRLRIVPIDAGNGLGPVTPSNETIADGTYQPLARPEFIYVRKSEADRPEVKAFVEFYLREGRELVDEVGYTALPAKAYDLALERFAARKLGSAFAGKPKIGVRIEDILSQE